MVTCELRASVSVAIWNAPQSLARHTHLNRKLGFLPLCCGYNSSPLYRRSARATANGDSYNDGLCSPRNTTTAIALVMAAVAQRHITYPNTRLVKTIVGKTVQFLR